MSRRHHHQPPPAGAPCPLPDCGRPSGDGGVCQQDTWRLRKDLEKVPGLVDDLHATMARLSRLGPASEKVDGRGESPVFFHQRAAAELRSLDADLGRWAAAVFGDAAWTAAAAAGWLLGALPDLRVRADADALWAAVQGAVWRAERAVDSPTLRTVIPVGPCPEEGCAGMVRAFIPAEDSKPAHMACDDAESPHSWGSVQWLRAGKRIRDLAERRARARAAS